MVEQTTKVLLIESDPNVIAAVHTAMTAGNESAFSLNQKNKLEDGLEFLERQTCDVILVCLALPDVQGLSTIARLHDAAPRTPIIVLSHDNDDSAAVSAVQAGAQDFLIHKEIDHALASAIRHALERAALLEELRDARDELERRVEERTLELRRRIEEINAGRERMRALSQRLVEVQEAERRHLARELHDEIGQLLTGLKLRLALCQQLSLEESAEPLNQAQQAVNELLKRVREMSLNLRPSVLDDLGLLAALNWHIERFTAQTGVAVKFVHRGLDNRRFVTGTETAAFRVVQESLTNVARHAGIFEASVFLTVNETSLQVRVEDRGQGFDPGNVSGAHASTGLAGMSERLMLLGGTLDIEAAPGNGVRINACLPL